MGNSGDRKKLLSNKDLLVWQKSMEIVAQVYRMTRELPAAEQWGLVSQMRRAAASVPSNITEAYGRQATGEYRHHLSISRRSPFELETQVPLCEKLVYLGARSTQPVELEIQQLGKMLRSLINKLH